VLVQLISSIICVLLIDHVNGLGVS
jgi:hypothetical protein